MKIQRLLIVLTLVNLVLLIVTLAQMRVAEAQTEAPMLRGRGLQIVDERGKVRASIQVLPASTQKNGEPSAETVLLRLITEKGRPSVKISASEQSSGLALAGPSNTEHTYVTLGAKGTTSSPCPAVRSTTAGWPDPAVPVRQQLPKLTDRRFIGDRLTAKFSTKDDASGRALAEKKPSPVGVWRFATEGKPNGAVKMSAEMRRTDE